MIASSETTREPPLSFFNFTDFVEHQSRRTQEACRPGVSRVVCWICRGRRDLLLARDPLLTNQHQPLEELGHPPLNLAPRNPLSIFHKNV